MIRRFPALHAGDPDAPSTGYSRVLAFLPRTIDFARI